MRKKLLLLLLSVGFSACKRDFRPVLKTGFEGKPLPVFNILLPDSATVLSTADIPKGSPLVLLFFSPNCPFSQAEMNSIVKDMPALKNVRFCIITNSPFTQLKEFYSYYALSQYSNITAGEDVKNYFQAHYKPIGVPYTLIFNKAMQLNKAFVGTMLGQQIEEIAKED